jgi:3-dehydroquinate dehydratase-2
MTKILVINGPNLNLLEKRETDIYGGESLGDIMSELNTLAKTHHIKIKHKQSNHEGKIVDILQNALVKDQYSGIIINAAAYTHTSIAIYDILKLFNIPIMEVHLSDPEKREEFRHFSYISLVANQCFKGMGKKGYFLALEALVKVID